jgi:hypothetical protein
MSDSDDSIIFEKQLTPEQAQEIADKLVAEGRFEIEFSVTNDRIRYSHTQSEVALRHIAGAITEAVQSNWPVEPTKYQPRKSVSLELGEREVVYNKLIAFDWVNRKIATSLGPKEGRLFLKVLAYFVEQFRAPAKPATRSEVN